jgi:undecaprenyl-diphosphatase
MSLDQRVFAVVNGQWTNPVLDWIAALVRASEIWLVPIIVVLVVVAWRGSSRARHAVALSVLVFLASDFTFVRMGKHLFARPRPEAVETVRSVRLQHVRPRIRALALPLDVQQAGPRDSARLDTSFPSGHAWSAFTIATVIALYYRRFGWLAFLPAALVGYSRVVAGLHWPGDVLLSALLAVPCTIGLIALLRLACARRLPRCAAMLPSLRLRVES